MNLKSALLAALCLMAAAVGIYRSRKENDKDVLMGPPWLLYSDEKLLQTFRDDALRGDDEASYSCRILYERLYLTRGDLTKAMPFLKAAAKLGDPDAIEILKDPEKYYRDFKARFGEVIPQDFHLN